MPLVRLILIITLALSAICQARADSGLIYGTITQVIDEGLLVVVRGNIFQSGERIPEGATILLAGKFRGYYDGDKIKALGIPAAPFEYVTVTGSLKTIRSFKRAVLEKIDEFPELDLSAEADRGREHVRAKIERGEGLSSPSQAAVTVRTKIQTPRGEIIVEPGTPLKVISRQGDLLHVSSAYGVATIPASCTNVK